MLTLYTKANTGSVAADIALAWSRLPHRVHCLKPGENHELAYLAINPLGSVPALAFSTGEVLTETAAILSYVDALSPDAFPAPRRDALGQATLVSWLSFLGSELQAAFGPVRAPGRFSQDPDHHRDLREQAEARIAFLFGHVEERFVGPFLFGAHRSVADPYLFVICRWLADTTIDLESYGQLASFTRHMDLDADIIHAMSRYENSPVR